MRSTVKNRTMTQKDIDHDTVELADMFKNLFDPLRQIFGDDIIKIKHSDVCIPPSNDDERITICYLETMYREGSLHFARQRYHIDAKFHSGPLISQSTDREKVYLMLADLATRGKAFTSVFNRDVLAKLDNFRKLILKCDGTASKKAIREIFTAEEIINAFKWHHKMTPREMARVSSYVTSTDIENTKKMTELLREHARKYYDIKKDFGIVMSMKESFIRDNFDFSEVNHEIIQRNTHQYVLSGCLTKLKRTLRREQRLRIFNEKFNGNCQFIINGYMNHLRMNTDAVAWSEILSIYDVQFLPEKTRDTMRQLIEYFVTMRPAEQFFTRMAPMVHPQFIKGHELFGQPSPIVDGVRTERDKLLLLKMFTQHAIDASMFIPEFMVDLALKGDMHNLAVAGKNAVISTDEETLVKSEPRD